MIERTPPVVLAQKAGFICAHLAIAFVIYAFTLAPIRDFFGSRNALIDDKMELLARIDGIGSQETTIQEFARNVDAELNRNEFLVGVNDGVVGADLQTRIKTILEAQGARLNLVQSLPSVQKGGIKYVGVRVQLAGTHASIQRAIQAVEAGKPYLFISGATLKSTSPPQSITATEPLIDAQLEVFGALRSGRE